MPTKRPSRRTKRPPHKRFLAHPATVFGLLCAGVFIVGWTLKATATSYVVSATVPAQPLSEGAVITSPHNGQVFTAKPINVEGTCPADSYVKLYRNGAFSGTAWCDNATNSFKIESDLSPGTNVLTAQDYNITDEAGPATPSVTVTYKPPAPQPPPTPNQPTNKPGHTGSSTTGGTSPHVVLPLVLVSDFRFRVFPVGREFAWTVELRGGTAPYAVTVEWGDGTTSTLALKSPHKFAIRHIYKTAGYLPVKVHAADSADDQAFLQLGALIKKPGTIYFLGTNIGEPPSGLNILPRWLWVAWPAYLIVLLMALSFWLGEREELAILISRQPRRRRHA